MTMSQSFQQIWSSLVPNMCFGARCPDGLIIASESGHPIGNWPDPLVFSEPLARVLYFLARSDPEQQEVLLISKAFGNFWVPLVSLRFSSWLARRVARILLRIAAMPAPESRAAGLSGSFRILPQVSGAAAQFTGEPRREA